MPWMDGWTMDSQSSSYSIWISTRWTDKQRLLYVQRCQIKRPRITITLSASPVCTPQRFFSYPNTSHWRPCLLLHRTVSLLSPVRSTLKFDTRLCPVQLRLLSWDVREIANVHVFYSGRGPLNRTIPRKLTEGEVYSATRNILNSFFNSSRLLYFLLLTTSFLFSSTFFPQHSRFL